MSDKLICFLRSVIDVALKKKMQELKNIFGGRSLIRNFNEFLFLIFYFYFFDYLATDLGMYPKIRKSFVLFNN